MEIRVWDGSMITEPGCYTKIPIEIYHNDTSLLPGPSVSKSAIKHIAPPEGNPKKFWSFWAHNPNRKQRRSSRALEFGKAVHAVLLGDEVFQDKFIVRPETVSGEPYHPLKTVWKRWFAEQESLGLVVLTAEEIEQIKAMAKDAAEHPLVKAGGLNGRVEVSMFARDPKTGIWLKSRPDVDSDDGVFIDLKSAGSLEDDFLSSQISDAGYYLQGALTRKICQLLDIPFHSFSFFYVLSKEYADSDFRVLADEDMILGEATIDYALHTIRHCLTTGEWPGASHYARENKPIRMRKWDRDRITETLKMEGFM